MSAAPQQPDQPAPDPPEFGPKAFSVATGAGKRVVADLEAYFELLATWNARMNLVGPSAMANFWLRHAYDSAQLLALAPLAKVWADLGAGAGFPGLVLAIQLKETPGVRLHLIESMSKRCVFLREVVAALDLPAEVHHARAEAVRIPGVEIVTARACAPLDRLLGFAWPLLGDKAADETVGLFLKGANADLELTEARRLWDFHVERQASRSDPSGQILRIERLRRVR